MLKIIKNKSGLVLNLSKLEKSILNWTVRKSILSPKYRFNTVSFKEKSGFNSVSNVPKRFFEDYRKIRMEMFLEYITEEDMKWIDENVYEDCKAG